MDVLIHYKVELAKRGKKIKNLSDALGLDYMKLSRILNGFTQEPPDFAGKVREVLVMWDTGSREWARFENNDAAAQTGGKTA